MYIAVLITNKAHPFFSPETSSGDGEFVKSQSLVSGGVVGSTKVSSLTDCCSGSGKEDADEETIKVDPRKLTRRKTKSSVGVDGELKKEVRACLTVCVRALACVCMCARVHFDL